jgi:hypothetical protein
MTGTQGQASVEWVGLLAVAAILGAALALIAGPRLVHAVRDALIAALPGGPAKTSIRTASVADIADVQSALGPAETALSPDAALLALARRNGSADAIELADRLVLAAALERSPSLGAPRTLVVQSPADGHAAGARVDTTYDRVVEVPLGAPTATWVTVAAQERTLAGALSHHADRTEVGLSILGLMPGLKAARELGTGAARWLATRIPKSVHRLSTGIEVLDVVKTDDGGVPGGMLAGDIVVSWPVRRTTWREGREEPLDTAPAYRRFVYFRPTAGGLAIVGEDSHR